MAHVGRRWGGYHGPNFQVAQFGGRSMTPECNSVGIFDHGSLRHYRRSRSELLWCQGRFDPSAARRAMDLFVKRRFPLPIELLIALALNVVVVVLGYCAILMWGFASG
jgi:hypothetical protein